MAATVKPKVKPKPKTKPKQSPAKKPNKKKATPKPTPIKRAAKDESLIIPTNAVIDLDAYDWGDEKLTDAQKLFVIWFATPGQECYRKAMKAARKAGYTPKTAHVIAHKLRREPRIDKLIRQFEETIGKINIVDAAQRWIQEKVIRGDYDIKDFYKTEIETNFRGKKERVLRLKDIEELTPEQRLCIDGVDVKGMQGTMVYDLPDREKLRDSLINFVQKTQGGDSDEYDIETVAEIIKGNIQVKTKVITRNREIMTRAEGFVDAPKKIIEEE